ncbi:Putative LOC101234274 [Caligus rogercresseyi]|uniref:LOC101234274 n=1 Tax=Caligus rogercresseyi TaxID=217165 RepID=A0A7T8GNI6_CALRO|nr:Putative LOC101234274 [Caligus rogercresseyi]
MGVHSGDRGPEWTSSRQNINGHFYGMENAEVTKTILCFIVKSLCCKYEDVVAMVPLPAVNSFVIKKW